MVGRKITEAVFPWFLFLVLCWLQKTHIPFYYPALLSTGYLGIKDVQTVFCKPTNPHPCTVTTPSLILSVYKIPIFFTTIYIPPLQIRLRTVLAVLCQQRKILIA
jgi:hypothetical protein